MEAELIHTRRENTGANGRARICDDLDDVTLLAGRANGRGLFHNGNEDINVILSMLGFAVL